MRGVLLILLVIGALELLSACSSCERTQETPAVSSVPPSLVYVPVTPPERPDAAWKSPHVPPFDDPALQSSERGVGPYTACMPEAELRDDPQLTPCRASLSRETCYRSRSQGTPWVLWVKDRMLTRIDLLSPAYRTPEALGVGSTLAELRAAYLAPTVMRGYADEWLFVVPERHAFFHLDDTRTATADALAPTVKVKRLELVFPCTGALKLLMPGRPDAKP